MLSNTGRNFGWCACALGGKKHESVISTAATMRVLNILRHWVSKHAQVACTMLPLASILSSQTMVQQWCWSSSALRYTVQYYMVYI